MQGRSTHRIAALFIAVYALLIAACAAPAPVPAGSEPTEPRVSDPGDYQDQEARTTISVWYSYERGGTEEEALAQALELAQTAFPDVSLQAEWVPFDAMFREFEVAVRSDGGPDLLLAPNDNLIGMVRGGFFAPLDAYNPILREAGIDSIALKGLSIDGRLYGFPQSLKTVVLFYNQARLEKAPESTTELLELLNAEYSLILHQTIYHQFGWLSAYGGRLFDDNRACIANQEGGAEWFRYINQLADHPNAIFSRDTTRTDATFTAGRADMIINGPWQLPEYLDALGDDLGIARLPGANQEARPLTGVDGLFINAYGLHQELATEIALYLSKPAIGQIFTDVAGHVPVNRHVTINDPRVQIMAEAARDGQLRPQIPELEAFWIQFDNALIRMLESNDDPVSALTTACNAMNRINGK
jgi:arabinogalactan oligomer/maltooligosaccharide transport system substrate-binding protein